MHSPHPSPTLSEGSMAVLRTKNPDCNKEGKVNDLENALLPISMEMRGTLCSRVDLLSI